MSDIIEMLRTPTGCEGPSEWELKAADEIERLRSALEEIDAVAVSKRAGAAKRMQAIARRALAAPATPDEPKARGTMTDFRILALASPQKKD